MASMGGELSPSEQALERRELVKLIREESGRWAQAAIDTMAGIMLYSNDPQLKLQAADKLLDRSVGRPNQTVEIGPASTMLQWMADPTAATDDDDVVDESEPLELEAKE